MASFSISINDEGLKELLAWAKARLSPEDQEALAGALDKTIEFGGWIGIIAESLDKKIFKTLIEKGVDSIFPSK